MNRHFSVFSIPLVLQCSSLALCLRKKASTKLRRALHLLLCLSIHLLSSLIKEQSSLQYRKDLFLLRCCLSCPLTRKKAHDTDIYLFIHLKSSPLSSRRLGWEGSKGPFSSNEAPFILPSHKKDTQHMHRLTLNLQTDFAHPETLHSLTMTISRGNRDKQLNFCGFFSW